MSSALAAGPAQASPGRCGAISLRGITRLFAWAVPAINHIGLESRAGEGKATLWRMIAGFDPPDEMRRLYALVRWTGAQPKLFNDIWTTVLK